MATAGDRVILNPWFSATEFDYESWKPYVSGAGTLAIGCLLVRYDAGGSGWFTRSKDDMRDISESSPTVAQLKALGSNALVELDPSGTNYVRSTVEATSVTRLGGAGGTRNYYQWLVQSFETDDQELLFGNITVGQQIGGCLWYGREGATQSSIIDPANDANHIAIKFEYFTPSGGTPTADGPVKVRLPDSKALIIGHDA